MTPEELEKYMMGECGSLAVGHQLVYPFLRFGIDWEVKYPGDEGYWEFYERSEGVDDPQPQKLPQHIFTHDDNFFYDATGSHPIDQRVPTFIEDREFDIPYILLVWLGMIDPEQIPNNAWIIENMPDPDSN